MSGAILGQTPTRRQIEEQGVMRIMPLILALGSDAPQVQDRTEMYGRMMDEADH